MYTKRNKEFDILALYTKDYTVKYYLREISRLTKTPLKTCQNILRNLEREKILKSKVDGKNKYFSLNLDNILVKSAILKAELHKTEIFLNKYPEFKIFLKSVNTNSLLIIFGSFAKSKADKNSDLDLFIVSNSEEKLPFHLLPYKIHENILNENSFRKAVLQKEILIKEIEESHIILNNHSSYVNIMWGYYGK